MPRGGRVDSPTRDLMMPFLHQPLRILFVDGGYLAEELAVALMCPWIGMEMMSMSDGLGAVGEGCCNNVTLGSVWR